MKGDFTFIQLNVYKTRSVVVERRLMQIEECIAQCKIIEDG